MAFRIFAFGSNGSGQLGIGHADDTSTPQQCILPLIDNTDLDEGVAMIVAGGNHTLILTLKGRLLAAGDNHYGQRCLPDAGSRLVEFHQVNTRDFIDATSTRVTGIAATWEASILVVDKRLVLSSGTGMKGELGLGPDFVKTGKPRQVLKLSSPFDGDTKVMEVVAGVNHVILVTSVGEVFGWGSSRKGQLGDDAKAERVVWRPRKIDIPFKVRRAGAGRNFTYLVGHNNEQLFLGDAKHFPEGVSLPLQGATDQIACGWSHIYGWSPPLLQGVGRNDRGQLPSENLPTLRCFAAGSEHCIASTNDNAVLAWGWGEHGNCGSPVDERGSVSGKFNSVPLSIRSGETITQVGAGCATSFVVLDRW